MPSTFPHTSSGSIERRGIRSSLMLPLLREGECIGVLVSPAQPCGRLHRRGDRARELLRRPGADRHRKHAAVQRNEGSPRPATGVGRSARGNQQLHRRHDSRSSRGSSRVANACSAARWRASILSARTVSFTSAPTMVPAGKSSSASFLFPLITRAGRERPSRPAGSFTIRTWKPTAFRRARAADAGRRDTRASSSPR